MNACTVTIFTTTDGKESKTVQKGEMQFSTPVLLWYSDENAKVTLTVERDIVCIQREGDYGMSLRLEQGKTTDGFLTINGAQGNMKAHTTKVHYSVSDSSLLLLLHYSLIFGEGQQEQQERQEMQIRLTARIEK